MVTRVAQGKPYDYVCSTEIAVLASIILESNENRRFEDSFETIEHGGCYGGAVYGVARCTGADHGDSTEQPACAAGTESVN